MSTVAVQTPPQATQAAREFLADYLRGYGRGNTQRLRQFADGRNWARHAAAVLDQRAYKFLEALEDFILVEIEMGTVSVPAIATAVADELDGTAAQGGHHA